MTFCFLILFTTVMGLGMSVQTTLLNNNQLNWIRIILTNSETPHHIRIKTQKIVATKYYYWTLKQVSTFRKESWKYRKNVNTIMEKEMFQYALTGLMKSICRYNGSGYFHKFAEKYVRGELLWGVTERLPLQPMKHGQLFSKNSSQNKMIPVSMVFVEEDWKYDKWKKKGEQEVIEYYVSNHSKKRVEKSVLIQKILDILEDVVPEEKRMFFYRYDKTTLEPIRTVYYVCKLMSFSEETYRKKMNVLNRYIEYQLKKNLLGI